MDCFASLAMTVAFYRAFPGCCAARPLRRDALLIRGPSVLDAHESRLCGAALHAAPRPGHESSARMHRTRRGAVAADQVRHIEAGDLTIDHHPIAADHDPVGAVGAA